MGPGRNRFPLKRNVLAAERERKIRLPAAEKALQAAGFCVFWQGRPVMSPYRRRAGPSFLTQRNHILDPTMSNTEKTFADRLARGNTLQTTVAGFTVPFAPADTELASTPFGTFLESVEDANDLVNTKATLSTAAVADHAAKMEAIKETADQVNSYVQSNKAWKAQQPAITAAVNAVHGYSPQRAKAARAAKKAALAAATPPPPAPKRKTGRQSYADIDALFDKLIEAVKLVPGYAPAATSGLSVADLETQSSAYRHSNDTVSETGAALAAAQQVRLDLFDGDDGLREKMKAIKKGVRGQYKSTSPEYAAVKAIRL